MCVRKRRSTQCRIRRPVGRPTHRVLNCVLNGLHGCYALLSQIHTGGLVICMAVRGGGREREGGREGRRDGVEEGVRKITPEFQTGSEEPIKGVVSVNIAV